MNPVQHNDPARHGDPVQESSPIGLNQPRQPAGRVKQTERPHPLTPLIRGWLVLVAIVVGLGRELVPDGSPTEDGPGFSFGWLLAAVVVAVVLAAVAGFFSWYFTRFVIDSDELRIETGAVFKNSKKVPFERLQSIDIIQPFAARIFGLAELRLEVGSGDSTIKLRYLTRRQAAQLRDYLLTRAHGEPAIVTAPGAEASIFTDLSSADKVLVTVSPQRLVASFLLSSEWLASFVAVVGTLIVTGIIGVVTFALPALIPAAVGAFSLISRRLVGMFNFTLAQSIRGVRVTRGLANLTSQSIPVNRIQGLRVTQPLLWRRFGWYRLDVSVLGYGTNEGEDNDSSATTVLLPVADADQVRLALSRVLPGVDLQGIELHPSPRERVRWLRPYDFWTLRYGYDDRVVITEHGWLTRTRNVVPHAKTQSVRLYQGPLQRALRLADVHFDITRGPVVAVARQIDQIAARALVLSELDRARAARAADRAHVPIDQLRLSEDRRGEADVLGLFGLRGEDEIGSGGESVVFALDERRVLRLYRQTHEAPERTIGQLRTLYGLWGGSDLGIEVPEILESGQHAGRWFSIDRRMRGRSMSAWLRHADTAARRRALVGYLDAAQRMQRLPSPVPGFARLIGEDAPREFATLAELLTDQLLRAVARSQMRLETDVPDVARVWDRLQDELVHRVVQPRLVHGDFCPPNVYLDEVDSEPRITGVGDFSPHTLHADPMMDVAGAVIFLELESYQAAAEDARWLAGHAVERLGPDAAAAIETYRRYFGFYFSSAHEFDPALYGWCVRQLDR